MNNSVYQKLKEESWRRSLTAAEEVQLQSYLAAHSELEIEWRAEMALNRLFKNLAEIAPASNFTAQVLQGVEREKVQLRSSKEKFFPSWWAGLRWFSRPAVAGLFICLGLFSVHQYQVASRTAMARSVAQVSNMASLPKVEWLQDFDTINRLNYTLPADVELLAALK
ncbi:MAG: hypothetical protein ACR2H1_04895 [Limisphaerales bacterium]